MDRAPLLTLTGPLLGGSRETHPAIGFLGQEVISIFVWEGEPDLIDIFSVFDTVI